MAIKEYTFTRDSMRKISESVRRDKRLPRNNNQTWRARRIVAAGSTDVKWALTPPGDELLIAPVEECMIAAEPVDISEYGSDQYSYATIGGFHTWCAGLYPETWYPVHATSMYVLTGGAWFLVGTAETGCAADGFFDMTIDGAPLTQNAELTVSDVHSPAGPIEAGSLIYAGWKGGGPGYVAILAECS